MNTDAIENGHEDQADENLQDIVDAKAPSDGFTARGLAVLGA